MFKKIIDNTSTNNTGFQFLCTFGYDCLRRIKNVQRKFNHMDWDIEKHPFQLVVAKIRAMLDCYQVIAHQIYNSCETAQLASLGHSVIKMFLQVSSAIKWLIKSFSTYTFNMDNNGENINHQKNRQSQSQKFRKKQIDRFILKGVMGKMDYLENQSDDTEQGVHNLFNQSKQNYQNTKNQIMAIGSSNLPIILQQAAEYLTKKSQYLDKFIALRQNYEGFNRIQSVPTSQAIIQSQHQNSMKNSEAFQKFKQIHNKFMMIQNKKTQINRIQFGVQTAPQINPIVDKFKKSAQQTKNKFIIEQLEKQKQQNKQLKAQLQAYQSKLNSSIKQYQQVVGKKKQKNLLSRFTQKIEVDQSQKSLSDQKQNPDQIQNATKSSPIDIQLNAFNLVKRSSHAFKKRSNYTFKRFDSNVQNFDVKNEISLQKQVIIQKVTTNKKLPDLQTLSQVYDLKIQNNLIKKILQINSSVFNISQTDNRKIQIQQYTFEPTELDLLQYERVSRRFISNKMAAYANCTSSITSTPIPLGDQRFLYLNTKSNRMKQNKIHIQWNKVRKNNKRNTNFTIQNRLSDHSQQIIQIKSKQVDFKNEFEDNYIIKKLKNICIGIEVVNEFFIDQKNAKNYQLLNISEIYSTHKKGRLTNKNINSNKSSGILSISPSCQRKQKKSSNIELENLAYNIISKHFYKQILSLKKSNKDMYLTLVLFIRYPYSSIYRKDQMRKKVQIQEENIIQFAQIQSHFRRIWNLHSNCYDITNKITSVKWCSHKQYILKFFGLQQKIDKKRQNSIMESINQ